MATLRIDLETRSSVDLRKCGVHKYVESDDFAVMLFGYAFDEEPVAVVDLALGEPLPNRVLEALFDYRVCKTAYNAAFEIACLDKHFGAGSVDPTQWRCTSVHALYLGMPGNLADVGEVVGLTEDQRKMAGWALIKYFCVPCLPTQTNGQRTRNLPHHDPAKWALFKEYCGRDVETERAIARRLAKFAVPDHEWQLWHLDQKMNARGIEVDPALVSNAITCADAYKTRLMDEAMALTKLENPNSRTQLLAWLRKATDDEGIEDLTKKNVPLILAGTSDATVRRVLHIRQELAKTSISKYQAINRAMCRDHRVRGLAQFYGANRTGRWAGRLVQVQNLPQNKLPDLDLARQLVIEAEFKTLEVLFGVSDTLSQLIRTAFVAPAGHRFIVVDFSAIEARVIAWLAQCAWRLDVFATHGKIYEASAEQMFKLPPGSVTRKSPYRQKGKIAELALGYQGGAGALKTMGALDMGLTEDELDPIKVAWRTANPEIVKLWYAFERAAKAAVQDRVTQRVRVGLNVELVFSCESGMLFIDLPSGRRLAYVKPRIEAKPLYHMASDGTKFLVCQAGGLTYEGIDQRTRAWTRLATYGGKLVENITQAIARDCLAVAMLGIDSAGYEQVMTVHDEIVVEAPDGVGSLAEVESILARPIPWAPGLLLRADGFETRYYQKEIE